jgi:hypothetical protein
MNRIIVGTLIVITSLFMLSSSNILAQEPCTADFDCNGNVDADDVTTFLSQFGRSPFNNPCPDCYDSPCPEPCTSNDDCDSGCCCEELDADRCHDQTYCESVLGSQCVGLPGENGEVCTANGDCASGNCECADAFCTTAVCSAIECACLYNTDGDSICDGFINPGIDDFDDTCGPTSACDGIGTCRLGNGQFCTANGNCVSGFCPIEDGVCCDTMCSGTCEACLASKTGNSDGICGPVFFGTDPDDECSGTEVCNGAGSCVSP